VLQPHGDVKPVEHRPRGDAGIGQTAPEPRTAVGEGGQCRALTPADSVEVAADQLGNGGAGSSDGAEDLTATGLRFNIADPHLQMPLALCATANERRIQGHHDRRGCCFRTGRGALTKNLADLQGMAAQGLMMRSSIDREHLLQDISGGSVGHQGREMRLKPAQLRRRPAMRWPANASLDPSARGTAKPGKPWRDLAEQRRHRMVPVVLHMANTVTARAFRPPNGMAPSLRSDDLPLNARQQLLRFGQGQTQVGDVNEIIGPTDLQDVRARPLALSPDLHQPQNPGHASTLGQRTNAKIPNWPAHPQSCGSPVLREVQAGSHPPRYAAFLTQPSPILRHSSFSTWYNQDPHHAGIGLMTPDQVHYGQANDIHTVRQQILTQAYHSNPERFVRKMPEPPAPPNATWINPPHKPSNNQA